MAAASSRSAPASSWNSRAVTSTRLRKAMACVAMSARMCRTAWKLAIGWLNCSRWTVCTRVISTTASAIPLSSAPASSRSQHRSAGSVSGSSTGISARQPANRTVPIGQPGSRPSAGSMCTPGASADTTASRSLAFSVATTTSVELRGACGTPRTVPWSTPPARCTSPRMARQSRVTAGSTSASRLSGPVTARVSQAVLAASHGRTKASSASGPGARCRPAVRKSAASAGPGRVTVPTMSNRPRSV